MYQITTKTKKMNTQKLRIKNKKDIIPSQIEGQSFMEYIYSNNGGLVEVYGYIGNNGDKIHKFTAYYIVINGENVIVSINSFCGSQTQISGLSYNFELTKEQVTCKKCSK